MSGGYNGFWRGGRLCSYLELLTVTAGAQGWIYSYLLWLGDFPLWFSKVDERVASLCLQIREQLLTVACAHVSNNSSVYLSVWAGC